MGESSGDGRKEQGARSSVEAESRDRTRLYVSTQSISPQEERPYEEKILIKRVYSIIFNETEYRRKH